ncbi:unnamed protein product [Miscanthus lutarioriparius]|uniref:AB hydrolase-1 domain-containing protein n=1 Tax=Miscanthus lutarioriparius TaxID=422564 RepID=A0A811NDW4_9POAL|nr:unnamed protein product [Miscanthus lutarioriparius]
MPPPPPAAARSRGRCSALSFAAARDRCFSHRFRRAGLRPPAVPLPAPPRPDPDPDPDPATTVHMWVPAEPAAPPARLRRLRHVAVGALPPRAHRRRVRPHRARPRLLRRLPDRSDAFQASAIKAAMDAIGVPRFGLVGVSYGGFVGHRMGAMFP